MKKYSSVAGRGPSSAPAFLLGTGPNRQYYTLVDAYCDNPNCEATEVDIELVPERDPARTISFRLELVNIAMGFPAGTSEEEKKIAIDFVEQNCDLIARRRLIIRAWALGKVRQKADYDPARLYCLEDFKVAQEPLIMPFQHQGKGWAVIDCYCVNPACPCEEMALQFYEDREGTPIPHHEHCTRLNLTTGAATTLEGNPLGKEAAAVLTSLQEALGDWRHELLLRRDLVRRVARRRLRFDRVRAEAGAGEAQLEPENPIRPASGPIFRNDPCPCGSGRKYKHCCGNR